MPSGRHRCGSLTRALLQVVAFPLLEFERRSGDRVEATFGGQSDGVRLKGSVKGDDGSTMGGGRIGIYTDTGKIGVKRFMVRGEVDEAWFTRHLGFLVAADPGPE